MIICILLLLPGIARAACTDPAAIASDVRLDRNRSALGYCNGTDWVHFRRNFSCEQIGAWTSQGAEANNWNAVTYGNGLFVAVSDSGTSRVMTSPDGTTWTSRTGVAIEWNSITDGNGLYVAVGDSGISRVMTSACNCSNPERPAGHWLYNSSARVVQWCDGANWVGAGLSNPPGPDIGCTAPVRNSGHVLFNSSFCALQHCDGNTWREIGDSSMEPCSCGASGTVCKDGTIYAGDHGGRKIFAARCDHGETWDGAACTGTAIMRQWKTANTSTSGSTNANDGAANTTAMAAAGLANHPAGEACRNLGAGWYLPASNELTAIDTNLKQGRPAGTHGFANDQYWSSTQDTSSTARRVHFDTGSQSAPTKTSPSRVRCVRR